MKKYEKHLVQALILLSTIGFKSCSSAPEVPESKEDYIFPFKTEVNALAIYYPPGVDKETYIEAEKCSDELKREILNEITPLSYKQLIAEGNQIHEEQFASLVTTHDKMAWAKEILEKMRPFLVENKYPNNLYAINGDYFNAFTIPGGNIYLTTGALNAVQNKDELAFIIGHELGHNENDHTKESARMVEYGRKMLRDWGFLGTLSVLAANYKERACGKSDELEADLSSIYLLHKAGFNLENALEGIALLRKFGPPKCEDLWCQIVWVFTGSHPWSEDRYAIAASYIKRAKVNAACDEIFAGRTGLVVTNRDPLTLRTFPSKNISGRKIPKGTTVEVICDCIEQEDDYAKNWDWLYVKYVNQDTAHYGWVDKQYIKY